jgi:hypothetical protein
MTLITINAVINISANVRVMEIVRVPAPMATRALENHVVVRIRMAGRAHTVGVPVGHWEPGMVERCPRPRSCVMARSASRREYCSRRLVHGVRGRVVIRPMAPVAVRWERCVIVVYVATRAGHFDVEASQWERRGVVIEFCVRPQRGVMAQLAVRGETHLDVVNWSDCRVVVL